MSSLAQNLPEDPLETDRVRLGFLQKFAEEIAHRTEGQRTFETSLGDLTQILRASRVWVQLRAAAEDLDLIHEPLFIEDLTSGGKPRALDAIVPDDARAVAVLPLTTCGRPLGALAVCHPDAHSFDLSERRFLGAVASLVSLALDGERTRERVAILEDESRRKDEFFAILGHELRNPLAPMLAALQLMKLRGDGSFRRERSMIERYVEHLLRLVDDLLDVARITQGKLELRMQEVEMRAVLAEALELVTPQFDEKRQKLAIHLAKEPLMVHGDPVRLAQVVINLLSNAAKYTHPEGRIELRAYADVDFICVVVADTGVGLTETFRQRLFEPFTQDPEAARHAAGGLGIGLAIAHRLVTMHGGTIEAHSSGRGTGSRFTIRLPKYTGGDANWEASSRTSDARPFRRTSPSAGERANAS